MATQIKAFAPSAVDGVGLTTLASYVGSLAARLNGVGSGIADPLLYNRAMRQATFLAAAMATAVSDIDGTDVNDDGDLAALVAKIKRAFGGAVSIGSNGYVWIGKVLLEWGSGTFPITGSTTSTLVVTLPLTFPNALLAVVGSSRESANSVSGFWPSWNANTVSASAFTAIADTLTGGGMNINFDKTAAFNWIAVGY